MSLGKQTGTAPASDKEAPFQTRQQFFQLVAPALPVSATQSPSEAEKLAMQAAQRAFDIAANCGTSCNPLISISFTFAAVLQRLKSSA